MFATLALLPCVIRYKCSGAIVGVVNTAGYSVGITNQATILAIDLTKLITAGKTVYDLILRHQMQRRL